MGHNCSCRLKRWDKTRQVNMGGKGVKSRVTSIVLNAPKGPRCGNGTGCDEK